MWLAQAVHQVCCAFDMALGRVDFCRQVDRWLGRQQIGVVGQEHLFNRRLGARRLHDLVEHIGGHNHLGAQVRELVLQLMALEQGAARPHHRAQLLDADMRNHILRAVLHEQRHPVPLDHTALLQLVGEGIAHLVQLGVADRCAVPDKSGLVGLGARMLAQVFMQRLFLLPVCDGAHGVSYGPGVFWGSRSQS